MKKHIHSIDFSVKSNFIYIILTFIFISFYSCKNKDEYSPLQLALKNHKHNEGFIGSDKCAKCHKPEYDDWIGSNHQLAMQLPTDKSVLGDFNNSKYTIYGVTSKFFKKDSVFYVNTEGPDGKHHDFEVKYTFGVYPLQQYLVLFPKGKLQVLTPFWDARSKENGGQKWQHLYPDEFIASHDELNWGRPLQNWNYMCAECHSTNVKKNYNPKTLTYNTFFDEINVSCEACHGPGDIHEKWTQNKDEKLTNMGLVFDIMDRDAAYWNTNPKSGLVTRSSERKLQMQVEWCARCHSRRTQLTDEYTYGKVLEHTHLVSTLDYPLYNDDGTNNDEDYVYGSFIQSKMYKKGVTCKDCHNVHSGELKAPKNNVCFQCHMPNQYQSTDHHKHKEDSTGASCISCHMPKITVMVVDPRSDHSIRIPRPDISVKTGATNACNNCHKDKTNEWSLENFKKWYGNKYDTISHFGFAFNNVRTNKPNAQTDLNLVIKDKNVSNIVLGTAIKYQDYVNNPLVYENLKMALNSKSALVRRAALESLRPLAKETQQKYALPMAKDSVFGVRHIANSFLFDMVTENLSPENQLIIKKAIETDSLNLVVQVNYADLKRMKGEHAACISILKNVISKNKEFSIAYQALAFAYIRIKDKQNALKTFELATKNVSSDPQNYYYLAVLLNDLGEPNAAISALKNGLKNNTNNESLLQLSYSIYRDKNQLENATKILEALKKLYPNNKQYQ
tara:strand:+ start:40157 stop:42349 length:2193 start_codon:yes stop_codon:yes gene_type:complete